MGAHHQIEVLGEAEACILHRQTGGMGIGEEYHLLAGGLECGQEGNDVGAPLDLLQDLLFEGRMSSPSVRVQ